MTYVDRPPTSTFGYQVLLWIPSVVFSFEFLFVLFLFAGRYKNDPRFQWLPVDLTALSFGLSVIVAFYILWLRGFKLQRRAFILVMLFAGFASYAGFSLIWTAGDEYATEKAFYIATLTFWPLVATAIIIAQDARRLHRFLFVLVLFSGWIAFEAFLNYLRSGGTGFVNALGGNYLGIGRVIGLGALVALVYLLFFAQNRLLKVVALALFGFFVMLLFVVGARGPLLATVLAALVPLLMGYRFSFASGVRLKRYVLPLVGIIGVGIAATAYLIETGNLTTSLERMFVLLESDAGTSAGERIDLYAATITLWTENPIFGQGIGSWPVLMGPSVGQEYPHNIFLEVMAELGLVGLSLFVTLLVFAWRALGPWGLVRNDPIRILIVMLFVNTFANALVSGDISDNRTMFAMLGLMMLTGKQSVYRVH